MSGAVFAQADGVVSKNKDRGRFHQGGQTNTGTHVVAEVEESRAKRPDAGDNQPVYSRTHAVLANSEMQIAAGVFARLEVARACKFQRRLVRGGQVCRTTDEPGYGFGDSG